MQSVVNRNIGKVEFWFMEPVKHLHQSLYDVKYRITLADLVGLHYAILYYHDKESAEQPSDATQR